ncbi:recombinase family protein [Streptomyces sp. NPDC088768]|uniref:recombinase family protein n=1 Tax=Streptomyces sp. NPDC088768 TaxID=3365894 RepID=UPI0037FDF373
MPIPASYLHLETNAQVVAYLYARQSRDPFGRSRSTEDQVAQGREDCAMLGWRVEEVFKDAGASATRFRRKERDDFESLLEALPRGEATVLVAPDASRMYRDLAEYVRLRDALEASGVLLCYGSMVFNMANKDDRRITAQDAVAAEDEGESIRARNLRTARRSLEQGAPRGAVPFGHRRRYDPDSGELVGQEPDPVQGPLLVRMFEMVDSGVSLYRVAIWLEEQGKPARHRSEIPWDASRVRVVMINPSHIGVRHSKGQLIGKAAWKAVVPEELYHRVVAKLRDPSRRMQRDSTVKHLLSRIGRCGECGALLKAKKAPQRDRAVPYYECSGLRDAALPETWLDAYVEEALFAWLRKPAAAEALIPDRKAVADSCAAAQRRLGAYELQLAQARELAKQFNQEGEPLLSAVSLSGVEQTLLPLIAVERDAIAEGRQDAPAAVKELLEAPDPETVWEWLKLEQKREVIRTVVNVYLHKASRRGVRRIEPGRIRLVFIGEPDFTPRPSTRRDPGRRVVDAPSRERSGPGLHPGTE